MVWPVNTYESGPTGQCLYITKHSNLGDGHFSVVKECMNKLTKERYAMKLIRKSVVRDKLQLIQREVAILKKISALVKSLERENKDRLLLFEGHHHVLQLFDYFETSKNIVLITQLCEPYDLYDKIIDSGHLEQELQVKPYTACLISALQFLHDNGIIHRDIKAENILFRLQMHRKKIEGAATNAKYDTTAHDLVIADFGLALKSDQGSKEYVGTVSYLAPEIVACRKSAAMSSLQRERLLSYGKKVDIWALGVLCYFMTFGYMPFDCDSDKETLDCIIKKDYYMEPEFKTDSKYYQFWSFIDLCFTIDSDQRPTASQLTRSPFIERYFHSNSSNDMHRSASMDIFIPRNSQSTTSLHSLVTPKRSSSSLSTHSDNLLQSTELDDGNLNKIRETLKKTLSMTSMRRESNQILNNDHKRNSTFKLAAQPPLSTLMNGDYCVTPESRSNFTTSPVASRATSRSNLSTAFGSLDETSLSSLGSTTPVTNLADARLIDLASSTKKPPKSYSSELTPKKITFNFGDEDESEEDVNSKNSFEGISIASSST